MPKFKPVRAWACVGSHGRIYITDYPKHEASGRLEVYGTEKDALRNGPNVVEVSICAVRRKKSPTLDSKGE